MQILVSGGAGFIGSHLCRRLIKEKNQVICVDNFSTGSIINIKDLLKNKNFKLIKHDIIYPLDIKFSINAIFHLASPASPNHHSRLSYHALPMQTMLANSQGTHNLLQLAKTNNALFLFASSSEVYGDPQITPQSETYYGNCSTTGPRSVYDEAKRFGETLTAHFWRREGVNARIARIFNTYGPGMLRDDMRMCINFINQALNNKPITIFGDGTQTRSLCYISDMVEGLTRLMFYPNTNQLIVNLGATDEHSVIEFARLIKKIACSNSKIVFSEALPQDDPKTRRPDISLAKKLLRWQPKIDLINGLTETIQYFKRKLKS